MNAIQTECTSLAKEKENLMDDLKIESNIGGSLQKEIRGYKSELRKVSGDLYIQTQRTSKLESVRNEIQSINGSATTLQNQYSTAFQQNKDHDLKTSELLEKLQTVCTSISSSNTQSRSTLDTSSKKVERQEKKSATLKEISSELKATLNLSLIHI